MNYINSFIQIYESICTKNVRNVRNGKNYKKEPFS